MNILTKLGTTAAILGIMATTGAPMAMARTRISIDGNGAESDNRVRLNLRRSFRFNQQSRSDNSISVGNYANTGGNTIRSTTGDGDSANTTGNVMQDTTVRIHGSINALEVPCGCEEDSVHVDVSDNGYRSDNSVNIRSEHRVEIEQRNESNNDITVENAANTGENSIRGTTGDGDAENDTGDVEQTVHIAVHGNQNIVF